MTDSEKYILRTDEFDPFYFFKKGVKEIKIYQTEDGTNELIVKIHLNKNGRIAQMDHIQLGWVAYPPGYIPKNEMSLQTTPMYDQDEILLSVHTRKINTGQIIKETQYDIKKERLQKMMVTYHQENLDSPQVYEIKYSYHKSDQLARIEFSEKHSKVRTQRVFNRDNSGNIIHEVVHQYFPNKAVSSQEDFLELSYIYDAYERVVAIIKTQNKKTFTSEEINYLNNSDQKIKTIARFSDAGLEGESSYSYNENGNIEVIINKTDDRRIVRKYEYTKE